MKDVLTFCHGLTEQGFDAGAVLIAEGEKTDTLFVLIEGRIEVLKGSLQVFETAEPGAVFGEMSALLDIPHTATVRTVVPSRVYVGSAARAFLKSRQEMTYCLSTLLAQRLHSVTTYLADLKVQFEDHSNHLGLVDEVLETLVHYQDEAFVPGSDRYPDTKI